MLIEVLLASRSHLTQAAELFDAYRQFYGQASDLTAAHDFLSERMAKNESIIYLALDRLKKTACGFMQLYPSFSSVSLQHVLILNDLFVSPDYRKLGIGKSLIKTAQELVQKRGFKGLNLQTARDNFSGQKLYQTCGFKLDQDFVYFFWEKT